MPAEKIFLFPMFFCRSHIYNKLPCKHPTYGRFKVNHSARLAASLTKNLFQGKLTQLLQCCSVAVLAKLFPILENISLSLYICIYINIELILYPSHYLFWNCNTATTATVRQMYFIRVPFYIVTYSIIFC